MTLSTMLSTMAIGMLRTFGIFALTLIGSLPLGMGVALLRQSRIPIVRRIIQGYIAIIRGTPLMLQLLVWYFGPYYLFGWNIGGWRFPAIILGFVVNYAAYFAEIYRGGIESIPVGQYEAAQVLGYTRAQTFMRIILPQVIKRIMPSVTNEVITLVKDTSLAFTLAYQEVFSLAKQISASQTSFVPFVIAGAFYFIANYVVAFAMDRIEKSMDYYK
ncbi:MAG: amino acid ABC transporter permease [Atopobiaceae bacterium]|nr:amino acid ABC transporter permease [Atopobiaceae bacterium]MBQ6650929.1 amino acid ABC transporter permease [Atopobiaceae bacterium]MBR3385391.1 amino acid ABC transporter permease [Atopobiaceae bacterium]